LFPVPFDIDSENLVAVDTVLVYRQITFLAFTEFRQFARVRGD
jgi:hypothetical protein